MKARILVATVALTATAFGGLSVTSASAQSSCQPGSGSSCPAPRAPASADPTSLVGSHAPATSGKNLTGKGTLRLASLLGEPTAVVFWLNTCPHCRAALPAINRLGARLGPGSQIVTASINSGMKGPSGFETPSAAAKTLHLNVPSILVSNDVAQREWHVAATPTAFILDSSGTITKVLQPADAGDLAAAIKAALASTD